MYSPENDEAFESIWEELRLLLEWQDGFGFYLVFSDDRKASTLLRERIESATRLRTRKLQWIYPTDPEEAIQEVLNASLDKNSDFNRWKSPLWIDLSVGASDDKWMEVRREVLSALNRRRGALEKDCQRPMLVQLPKSMAPEIVTWAPDLWSIRQYIAVLPSLTLKTISPESNVSSEISPADFSEVENTVKNEDIVFSFQNSAAPTEVRFTPNQVLNDAKKAAKEYEEQGDVFLSSRDIANALASYQDALKLYWRLYDKGYPNALSLLLRCLIKTADCERDCGNLAAALQNYLRYVELAKSFASETPPNIHALRILSIGLNRLGKTYRDKGQFQSAIQNFQKCLTARQKIHELVGDNIQSLRDLATAYCLVGDMQRLTGEIKNSVNMQRRAVELLRQVINMSEGDHDVLRDMSIALGYLGDAEYAAGNMHAAKQAREECLAINRKIDEIDHDPISSKSTLSVALDRMGDLERALGNQNAALELYAENLSLRRRMHQNIGDTPEILRGLAVSLGKMGDLEVALGEFTSALGHFQEAALFSERLCHTIGETPQTLRALAISKARIANLELVNGDSHLALRGFSECLQLFKRIKAIVGSTPQAIRDITITLDRLGKCERESGNENAALKYFKSAIELARNAIKITQSPQSLQDLARSLRQAREAERKLGRHSAARKRQLEIIKIWEKLRKLTDLPDAESILATEYAILGDIEKEDNKQNAALASYQSSIEKFRSLKMSENSASNFSAPFCMALLKQSELLIDSGKKNFALSNCLEAVDILRTTTHSNDEDLKQLLIDALMGVAKLYHQSNNKKLSLAALTETLEILRSDKDLLEKNKDLHDLISEALALSEREEIRNDMESDSPMN